MNSERTSGVLRGLTTIRIDCFVYTQLFQMKIDALLQIMVSLSAQYPESIFCDV